ncbi:Piso0_000332 [Millerozyma farinosa CBS 7064]|uniref:mitogen-activated protein kinase kinase kinase n=1 Tax=Pichia sorbitophila (strain ATCC MYA-4447 / BCRC 22081 / CBS 7064 / NBRC 10061 / NRRL Y-12695) TaxID=559304 RepID=G8YTP8_PICSO|nr:Piso0_000332 [Millerozyma farinosa CBS 7064]CCE73299.1 Piso0_000332 [Millerozyma farinosa CBS 7064]
MEGDLYTSVSLNRRPSENSLPHHEYKNVKQWLSRLGLQQYYNKFVENGITFDIIPELDTSSLKELGILKVGDRIKLELAISDLKTERLNAKIPIDELRKLLELYDIDDRSKVHIVNTSNGSLSGNEPNGTNSQTLNQLNSSNNKNITFILQDGSLKKVNVTGCFNAQSIKRKVLKKLGFKSQEVAEYDTYIYTPNDNVGINLLYDVELVTICYSPDRDEKHRIILCPKGETPSDYAIETSKKIKLKYETFYNGRRSRNNYNINQYHFPDGKEPFKYSPPLLRNFFGQRPPSELISSNLAEYFPEAPQKDLEATVRNSLRYSVRLSKRFGPGGMSFTSGDSSSSFQTTNKSNAANTNISNISDPVDQNTLISRRVPSGRTIGDVMVSNSNAIGEAKSFGDNYSLQQPPSLSSDPNISNDQASDEKSVTSMNYSSKTNNRFSIATSFLDMSSSNNRNSRIELFSVDSDDEYDDDILASYGIGITSDESDGSVIAPIADCKSRNWLRGARIGAGSFGTVFLGMNPLTGELMAVKQVRLPDKRSADNSSQRGVIEALEHEMSLLKQLDHENIVRYLGSSFDEEFLNIFLEYVPGGSVQSMLSSYGPFEEPLIRNFIRQVLIGLSYLHGEDIIHRDIKGANILIDIKGTVKISDFGISKKVGSNVDMEDDAPEHKRSARRASLQGSVYWMAPEVVKQTAYTKKADIWSVGCLIIEMFTGKHPFPDFSQMQAIFKIGTHITPQIPEWCTLEAKQFLEKTFELDYQNRPDAVDLLEEPFLNPLIMSKQ